jgi:hypothetical protein
LEVGVVDYEIRQRKRTRVTKLASKETEIVDVVFDEINVSTKLHRVAA